MFQLKAHGTDVKTEVISGFTTFFNNGLYHRRKPGNPFSGRRSI